MSETNGAFKLDAKFYGLAFEVRTVSRSAFAGFGSFTNFPYHHLTIISTYADAKWNEWDKNGLGLIHQVTGYVEKYMKNVVGHFFGDTLAFEDAAWRFEVDSPHATRKQTPHAHLLVWHRELNPLVRRCDETCMNPQRLIGENIAALLGEPEQKGVSFVSAFPSPPK
jgi:hypothetical protein